MNPDRHILVTGVRHRTAPIAVRECFALREDQIADALAALKAQPGILECAILSTCNRTEFYITTDDVEAGMTAIRQFGLSFQKIDYTQYRPHLFTLLGEDAALHLLRVASGLDSLILGEGQILGQVKDALSCAQQAQSAGTYMDKLFKAALSAGKRVRTETGIAEKDVSVSRAAFEFAKDYDPQLFDRKIALVGGGKMAEILMASLKHEMTPAQLQNIRIVNRSERRLETLAAKHGLTPEPWENLDAVLNNSDVLFVATGAPHVIFGQQHFKDRGDKLIIDIAVPRNVDPRVNELPNVKLFNTDNLSGIGNAAFSDETQALLKAQAQEIIEEEYLAFHQWQTTLSIVPTITQLHAKFERTAGNDGKALIKKILHEPTVRLKSVNDPDALKRHAATLTELFDLNE